MGKGKAFILDGIKGYAFEYPDGSIWIRWGTLTCDLQCMIENSRLVILRQISED